MIDRRELILRYFEGCLKAIAPGAVFPVPGPPHREIVSDVGGRVYTRILPETQFSGETFPVIEMMTSATEEDTIKEAASDAYYLADLNVDVIGYVRVRDANAGGSAAAREEVNALRADIIVAAESLPYWTGPDFPEPLRRRCGEITMLLKTQFTDVPPQYPTAFCAVSYAITYSFSRTHP